MQVKIPPNFTASRYHDISCGHRVYGHEGKCANLHGHNYRIHFHCRGILNGIDDLGRVIDFSIIKEKLCMWIERNWDHKFLIWEQDPIAIDLVRIDNSVLWVTFNPTAENMAEFLIRVIGPTCLVGTGVELYKVEIEETRKCSITVEK